MEMNRTKTLAQIRSHIDANMEGRRAKYDGLTSSEIGTYNGAIMFGDNYEAFPGDDEWSRIVD